MALSMAVSAQETFKFGTNTNPDGVTFEVDSRGFIIGGRHVLPVMGEIHYSRVPEQEWRREIQKMKAGGITVIATYVFWIHQRASGTGAETRTCASSWKFAKRNTCLWCCASVPSVTERSIKAVSPYG